MTRKLSQYFTRTERRILGAQSRFVDFLLNPLKQGHSRTISETSRVALSTNQGTNEDEFQCDLHHEASISQSQNTRSSGTDEEYDNIPGSFLNTGTKLRQKNYFNQGACKKRMHVVFTACY